MKAALLAVVSAVALGGCDKPDEVTVFTGEAMGTTYRIKCVGAADFDTGAIDDLCRRLDGELSTWRDDSWVAKFNAAPVDASFEMPDAVSRLLEISRELSAETGGRFDPTVGALVKLWGFGAWGKDWPGKPSQEEIDMARAACGFGHLGFDGRRVTKRHPRVMLDFSAIAKGYTVDRIAELMRQGGYRDFVIEFGGEVFASGAAPGKEGWMVGGAELKSPLLITDGAVATSGSEHQSRGLWSHVIDPRSGWPVPPGPPATVRAETCARADALATAAFVKQAEGRRD